MNENEFERLQELLKVKRLETPPPGYFRDFSFGVVARIRREEESRPKSIWERLAAPWSRPARLAWANALLFVGLGGVAFSLYYTSVTTPKDGTHASTVLNPYSGVGMAGVVPVSNPPESLISLGSPVEIRVFPGRVVPDSNTNPFPQGLFQLPENQSMRVGFGGGR